MGALDEYDILTGLACLEKVLYQWGINLNWVLL